MTTTTLILIIIGGAIALFILMYLASRLRRQPDLYGWSREEIAKRWSEIEKLMNGQSEIEFKMAVLEADKILDGGLKSLGIAGTTTGERLKVVGSNNPKLRDLWFGHKIRNRLVHEPSYHLSRSEAVAAIKSFKQGLKDLRLL